MICGAPRGVSAVGCDVGSRVRLPPRAVLFDLEVNPVRFRATTSEAAAGEVAYFGLNSPACFYHIVRFRYLELWVILGEEFYCDTVTKVVVAMSLKCTFVVGCV